MTTRLHGADLDGLTRIGAMLDRHGRTLTATTSAASADVNAIDRLWSGPDSAVFHQRWVQHHRPAMLRAARALADAGATVARNRDQQDRTSAADGVTGAIPPLPLSAATAATRDGPWDAVGDFLFGDIANFWTGGEAGFPTGSAAAAAIRMLRISRGELPLFNTGRVGQFIATNLVGRPGFLGSTGAWLGTPAASAFFRRAGIVGGVASTGLGLYDLYQQGNPVDAFEREGAGYVADVASTAFSASATAFLVAPNPVTGALAVGTGAVWLGAEVVDNWDEIAEFAGDAWDAGTDFVGDVGGGILDTGGDLLDAGGDLLDAGGDVLGTIGGWLS